MGQAIFSVRMDEDLKKEFEELCNNFGMNMTTAINVFAKAVVRERKIPFEISEDKRNILKSHNQMELERMKEAEERNKFFEKDASEVTLSDILEELERRNKDE